MAEQPDNTEHEEWRDVPGYEGLYAVSSAGRVKSLQRIVAHYTARSKRMGTIVVHEKIRRPSFNDGYPRVTLSKDGDVKTYLVHKLVLLAFVGPLPNGTESAHLNGDRADPRKDNLAYVTKAENEAHKVVHRIAGKEAAEAIIRDSLDSGESQIALARRLRKVSQRALNGLEDL